MGANQVIKKSAVLSFQGGELAIRIEGYDANDGSGEFQFDDDNLEHLAHDDRDGSYWVSRLLKSELEALRDFLNEWLPNPADADLAETKANQKLLAERYCELATEHRTLVTRAQELEAALQQAAEDMRERVAKVVQDNQETIRSGNEGDERFLAPRRSGNVTGIAYSTAIRTRPLTTEADR
jgi:hypothetical protein